MLQQLVPSEKQLQLKVLSSAHLEKDFIILINPLGIVPSQEVQNYDNQVAILGNENGPRRGAFDGFTYFGVEDTMKDGDQENAGTTGGYIEDNMGNQILKEEMNDFIIPTNNPNNSQSKEQTSNPMMGGNNH